MSDLLQACSYDGEAFKVDPRGLAATPAADGEKAVRDIMRFTGLPQNFKVVEGEVPNAAALILMGNDGIPQRIIAYNAGFMKQVGEATSNSDWASVSIVAHEIGHHLSGHTLMPGGSQPPIELEADKFSGFVLYKMGATLADATKAISTLIPEEDGQTHPGRSKRLVAVEAGWSESCEQQTGSQCAVGAADSPQPRVEKQGAVAEAASEAQQNPATEQGRNGAGQDLAGLSRDELESRLIEVIGNMSKPGVDLDAVSREMEALNSAISTSKSTASAREQDVTISNASVDRLPRLSATSTPSKFDRFVYDEAGMFDPEVKDKLAKAAFDYAASNNIEIVTIVAKDLQGRDADRYALDAMRQLRVGKMEVGNGAVLVVDPGSKQVGIALGAGLLVEYEDTKPLRSYLESFFRLLEGGTKPAAASELIAEASYRIMRDTKAWEWAVRFQSLEEMITTEEKADKALTAAGESYDPLKSPTWRKLARVHATIVTTTPSKTDKTLDVSDIKESRVGAAIHIRSTDGRDAIVYVNPTAAALMPVPLEQGKTYSFVVRESFLDGDTPSSISSATISFGRLRELFCSNPTSGFRLECHVRMNARRLRSRHTRRSVARAIVRKTRSSLAARLNVGQ
ncbi:TPM domain-containing protein (plasmid) [Rhizobium sp. 32-5/1]|uniref:TPM domain-containing protein n=1 Tax=Rhizobium sp. 32-5/1 TaxID=3019602 RepID=UPI00240E0B0C|nr:TPM domain-containing protein [Rhizobium sp. 32-5/1]WEZ85719.1 TPM domain-containing protein [Rhizobium sp. 32-5/1]